MSNNGLNQTVLKVAGLHVAYGGIKAVKGIDLEVNEGELIALIGANGAGKTTTLKAITGTLPACKVEGTISYLGESLKGTKSCHLVERKLAMVLIMLIRPAGLWPSPKHEDRPDHDVDQPNKSTGVVSA